MPLLPPSKMCNRKWSACYPICQPGGKLKVRPPSQHGSQVARCPRAVNHNRRRIKIETNALGLSTHISDRRRLQLRWILSIVECLQSCHDIISSCDFSWLCDLAVSAPRECCVWGQWILMKYHMSSFIRTIVVVCPWIARDFQMKGFSASTDCCHLI